MNDRLFVLRSDDIRQRAIEFVSSLPITDRPFEIVIRPHKTKRSLDQNSYYWVRIAEITMHVGQGSEEVHEYMKDEFLLPIVVDMLTHSKTVSGSTTKLSPAEMAEYTTKVEAWAVNNGIRLSELTR